MFELVELYGAIPIAWKTVLFFGLLFFFIAAIHGNYFAIDWIDRGAMRVGLFRDREWWRAFTALFLHYDTVHLFSNLAFGTLFLLLLSQVAGAGMASLDGGLIFERNTYK